MTKAQFLRLEQYMGACMQDSAHDKEHVYRVLYTALDIAAHEPAADPDVLIAACVLHDIGRQAQYDDPTVCHAEAGAALAYSYLVSEGYEEAFAKHVADCIQTHRFRKHAPPATLEAKILFDADKLDAAGLMGIARTLLYNGKMEEPLYSLTPDGSVSDGREDRKPSFLQEYTYKLEHIYDRFLTCRGRALAEARKTAAKAFYENLLAEARSAYSGKERLFTDFLK